MQFDPANLEGATGTATIVVSDADTAIAAGSGDLPVLATPRMVALMEQAACTALAPALPPEATTVGVHVDVRHRAPSPVGATVTATARVMSVSGARVLLAVEASHDAHGGPVEVGSGSHTRVLVDRATFLA